MAQTFALPSGAVHSNRRHAGATHARGFRLAPLDFTRIGAEAGAIALNAAALLLLLAPLSPHLPPAPERRDLEIVIPITPPKPPEKIREVEVAKPRPRLVPIVAPTVAPPKIEVQPPLVDPLPGDIAVEPDALADGRSEPAATRSEPLDGAHLEYAAAPPPPYPVQALREGLTGTVTLRVLVDVDGRPLAVTIERSSGHRVLDAVARRQVLAKWRFRPARHGGQAVQAIGLVPVEFHLDR